MVVDRIVVKEGIGRRLTEAIENAVKLADGLVIADLGGEEVLYSTKYACPDCELSFEELTRGCSRSTIRTAPARCARGWGSRAR